MSMPTIPNITPSISLNRCDTINLLLSSIALEELGLSHILNAEGEKLQHFLKTFPKSLYEFLQINESINKTLRTVVKSQILLEFKLEEIAELDKRSNCGCCEESSSDCCVESSSHCCAESSIECCEESSSHCCSESSMECCEESSSHCCAESSSTCCDIKRDDCCNDHTMKNLNLFNKEGFSDIKINKCKHCGKDCSKKHCKDCFKKSASDLFG